VRKSDNLTTILCYYREIWEVLTSWNPLGHSRPVTGLLYLHIYIYIVLFLNCELYVATANRIKKQILSHAIVALSIYITLTFIERWEKGGEGLNLR